MTKQRNNKLIQLIIIQIIVCIPITLILGELYFRIFRKDAAPGKPAQVNLLAASYEASKRNTEYEKPKVSQTLPFRTPRSRAQRNSLN